MLDQEEDYEQDGVGSFDTQQQITYEDSVDMENPDGENDEEGG